MKGSNDAQTHKRVFRDETVLHIHNDTAQVTASHQRQPLISCLRLTQMVFSKWTADTLAVHRQHNTLHILNVQTNL